MFLDHKSSSVHRRSKVILPRKTIKYQTHHKSGEKDGAAADKHGKKNHMNDSLESGINIILDEKSIVERKKSDNHKESDEGIEHVDSFSDIKPEDDKETQEVATNEQGDDNSTRYIETDFGKETKTLSHFLNHQNTKKLKMILPGGHEFQLLNEEGKHSPHSPHSRHISESPKHFLKEKENEDDRNSKENTHITDTMDDVEPIKLRSAKFKYQHKEMGKVESGARQEKGEGDVKSEDRKETEAGNIKSEGNKENSDISEHHHQNEEDSNEREIEREMTLKEKHDGEDHGMVEVEDESSHERAEEEHPKRIPSDETGYKSKMQQESKHESEANPEMEYGSEVRHVTENNEKSHKKEEEKEPAHENEEDKELTHEKEEENETFRENEEDKVPFREREEDKNTFREREEEKEAPNEKEEEKNPGHGKGKGKETPRGKGEEKESFHEKEEEKEAPHGKGEEKETYREKEEEKEAPHGKGEEKESFHEKEEEKEAPHGKGEEKETYRETDEATEHPHDKKYASDTLHKGEMENDEKSTRGHERGNKDSDATEHEQESQHKTEHQTGTSNDYDGKAKHEPGPEREPPYVKSHEDEYSDKKEEENKESREKEPGTLQKEHGESYEPDHTDEESDDKEKIKAALSQIKYESETANKQKSEKESSNDFEQKGEAPAVVDHGKYMPHDKIKGEAPEVIDHNRFISNLNHMGEAPEVIDHNNYIPKKGDAPEIIDHSNYLPQDKENEPQSYEKETTPDKGHRPEEALEIGHDLRHETSRADSYPQDNGQKGYKTHTIGHSGNDMSHEMGHGCDIPPAGEMHGCTASHEMYQIGHGCNMQQDEKNAGEMHGCTSSDEMHGMGHECSMPHDEHVGEMGGCTPSHEMHGMGHECNMPHDEHAGEMHGCATHEVPLLHEHPEYHHEAAPAPIIRPCAEEHTNCEGMHEMGLPYDNLDDHHQYTKPMDDFPHIPPPAAPTRHKPDIIKVEFVPEEISVTVGNSSKTVNPSGKIRVQFVPGEAIIEPKTSREDPVARSNKELMHDKKIVVDENTIGNIGNGDNGIKGDNGPSSGLVLSNKIPTDTLPDVGTVRSNSPREKDSTKNDSSEDVSYVILNQMISRVDHGLLK